MVESCGCAQYAQPLPNGAEYCNYKKNPNWSKCQVMATGATCTLLAPFQQKIIAFLSSFSNTHRVPFLQCTATTDCTRSL